MTPLAHAIAKQEFRPARKRKPVYFADAKAVGDPADFISDIHCFECSDVLDIACGLVDDGSVDKMSRDPFFLPAPKTWVEHRDRDGGRTAWLLTENPFHFYFIFESGSRYVVKEADLTDESNEENRSLVGLMLAMLALINTPHVIGRQEYPPHRGLQRLWQQRPRKAPLNAWHELKLSVAKPIDIDDGEPHAANIGGRRALHFCRAHLRIREGRLEFVTSHWRGDPALGTKLTRYKISA